MKPPRPLSVTMLAWIVLSLSVYSLIRFGAAIAQWQVLAEFAPRPGPLYILLTGLIWGLSGLLLAIGLWIGHPLAGRINLPISLGYTAYYWADRLFLQHRPEPSNWPVALVITLVVLIFPTVIFLNPNVKIFFSKRETHER